MISPRILVVDDTPDLLGLFSTVLEQAGYEVLQAATAYDCLRIVREQLPDLVLLDVMLPDMSGIEACKQIKADDRTAGVFVTHISGMRMSTENQVEGLEAGADGYLTKPIDARVLLAHVNALLRIKRTEEALHKSEVEFRAAFDNAMDGMLIVDDQSRCIDANPTACSLIGLTREEMRARRLLDLIAHGLYWELETDWQEFLEQGQATGEFRLHHRKGLTTEVEYRARANFLPGRHLWVLRDVSERKKSDEALQDALDTLEDRVAQRTAELLAANSFLKEEIVERSRAEKALAERLEFETLLTELSEAFANLPSERVDQEVEDWLRSLVEFMNIDRAVFLHFEENGSRCHSYTVPGVEPLPVILKEQFPWSTAQIRLGNTYRWSRIPEDVPNEAVEERQYVIQQRLKSSLTIPVTIGGSVVSAISFATVRAYREWPDEIVGRLGLVGEIFANAFVRRQAKNALKESEERFRLLVEGVRDYAIVMLDCNGYVVSWNEGVKRINGYEQEEFLGKHFTCFYGSEEILNDTPAKALKAAAVEGRYEEEGWRIRKGGSRFWAHVVITALRDPSGELKGFSKVTRDVTERKRAEEALKQSEDKYRSIVENVPDVTWWSDSDGNITYIAPNVEKVLGYTPDELYRAGHAFWFDIVDLNDVGFVKEAYRMLFQANKSFNIEYRIRKRDGHWIWLHDRAVATFDEGNVKYAYGLFADNSDRKQWQEQLRQSEEKYRDLVENIHDIIYATDENGVITYISRAVEWASGLSPSDIIGQPFTTFLHPDDVPGTVENFQQSAKGNSEALEFRIVAKSGEVRWMRKSSKPLFKRDRFVGTRGLVTDITERKRAEEARKQLQRRLVTAQEEERRRLSRELHDQMGQSLAALMLGLKSLDDSGEFPSAAKGRLQQLQKLTNQLAQEVHTLARDLRPTALDDLGLHTALANYVEEWSERSHVQSDFHSNGLIKERLPPHIETAVYRIVQEALTNVLKHAQATNVSVIVENRAGRVRAIVEDNGCGFDADAMMKVPAKERGLGLLGMQERVTLLGGSINVESAPNVGTTVLANIPVEV